MRSQANDAGSLLMQTQLNRIPAPTEERFRRALPPQYFSAIAAWNDRRSATVIFELANFRSSIWEAANGDKFGSMAGDTVSLGWMIDEGSILS